MISLLVNAIVAFWIILFGAMAIMPFMLDGKPRDRSTESATSAAATDDRVISIRPVGLVRSQPGTEAPGQVPASILAAANARAASLDDLASGHHRQAA